MAYGRFAEYYDLLYQAQHKDYEREACRLHRLIQRYKSTSGNRLLDVGCGTGEHLRYLQDFCQVEGVDLSAEMLQVAQQKLPTVPFHQGDMRAFQLNKRFEVIVCLFGTIGYAETVGGLQQAVANMRRHLVEGGVLFIEPWLGPGDIEDGHTHVVVAEEGKRKVIRVGVTWIRERVSEVVFHFVIAEKEGIKTFEERHQLGLFSAEEYRSALERSGLQVFYEREGLSGRGVYVGYLSPA